MRNMYIKHYNLDEDRNVPGCRSEAGSALEAVGEGEAHGMV